MIYCIKGKKYTEIICRQKNYCRYLSSYITGRGTNMPRYAREKQMFGVFYIHQTSNAKGLLFKDDVDRKYFLDVLKKSQDKFRFKLYGYCMLDSNSYHLILDANGCDVSNIMKSINIRYAMYKNCDYPIFKDRYKSKIISTQDELYKTMESVNKKSESMFNSYCHYDEVSPINLDWIAPLDDIKNLRGCKENAIKTDNAVHCIDTLSGAEQFISKMAIEGKITPLELLRDKTCRNQLIKDLRRSSSLTLKEIGLVVGGLSESSVSKILNKQ